MSDNVTNNGSLLLPVESGARYWTANDDGSLTWVDNPYMDDLNFTDVLDFEGEIVNPAYTLQQIANALDAESKGLGLPDQEDDCWVVCRFKVWQITFADDIPPELIAILDQTTGAWQIGVEDDPESVSNRATRRLMRRGCLNHRKERCI